MKNVHLASSAIRCSVDLGALLKLVDNVDDKREFFHTFFHSLTDVFQLEGTG